MKTFFKYLFTTLGLLLLLLITFLIYFRVAVVIRPPKPENLEILEQERLALDSNFYAVGNNWLRKSESGLWEMYVEGEAFERGAMKGILAKDLIYRQEKAFINEIKRMIPSEFYLRFLKYFIAWYNKDMVNHISKEYQLEIYGVSKAASEEFAFIGPPYLRFLNYHAAHDIGHTLQSLGMVGCTSFATWGKKSKDSLLIVGRNFDFYVGDEFSKEKIVAFYAPDSGYKFMSVTWGGMIGVVSGMNEKGLSVTINAGASGIPLNVKTPVSILAREILQYAENIEEAYKIAGSRETFVAEAFLIASAQDNKAVIIEKGLQEMALYAVDDRTQIICTNHFLSETFAEEQQNMMAISHSSSPYRYKRVKELIDEKMPLDHLKTATILRDQKGIAGADIGMGNEKAINQLIAHHSVIFIPEKRLVWVSTQPYQLGKYVAYDLNKIFDNYRGLDEHIEIYSKELEIPADSFLFSGQFQKFQTFRELKNIIINKTPDRKTDNVDDSLVRDLIASNPMYFLSYSLAGDYYKSKKQYAQAAAFYEQALKKEITTYQDKKHIKENLRICREKAH